MPEFKYHGVNHQPGYYSDYEFSDGDLCKQYVVSYDHEKAYFYGIIRTSEGPEDGFEGEEDMPVDVLDTLVQLIPQEDKVAPYGEPELMVGVDAQEELSDPAKSVPPRSVAIPASTVKSILAEIYFGSQVPLEQLVLLNAKGKPLATVILKRR